MPAYVWKGKTRDGKAVSGERVADSKEAVMALLRRDQILVSSVKEKGKEMALPVLLGLKTEKEKFAGALRSFDDAAGRSVVDGNVEFDVLREQKILVSHGRAFNWVRPDHFRMVTLPNVKDIEEAIGRMGDFLSRYQGN